MARHPRALTEADRAIWSRFAEQLTPLSGRAPREPEAPADPPATRVADVRAAPAPPPRQAPKELVIGQSPGGVDRATWARFRGGRMGTVRTLDLHGMTAQQAHRALSQFIRTAHADHVRCVEVVTGRGSFGGGTIRREFPFWLNHPDLRPLILAASHPHVANPGSVRLLLRRIR